MITLAKLLTYWKAALVGLLIAYIGFLNVRLWYKGLDLGATSIYSYRPAPYLAEHTKKWRRTKLETFPCVKVQGVRVAASMPATVPVSSNQHTAQTSPGQTLSLGEIQLGEWKLEKLPYGGLASAQLDSEGLTRLIVSGNKPRFLEVGGGRAIGLSVGYPIIGEDHSLSYEIYFRQQLLRTGPVWWNGKLSAGHWNGSSNDLDLSVGVEAEVRF